MAEPDNSTLNLIFERLGTIERNQSKTDAVLNAFIESTKDLNKDHEQRIRNGENRVEECKQVKVLEKLEERVSTTEDKIDKHLDVTKGIEKGTQWIRDLIMIGAGAALTYLITVMIPAIIGK